MNFLSDILTLSAVVAFFYAAVLWVLTQPAFPLERVVLTKPLGNLSAEDVQEVVRTGIRGNFFTVNLDRVQHGFEALSWVRSASVRRQWPGTVEVSLVEHVPAAHWKSQENDVQQQLVDTDGEVFAAKSVLPLPRLSGPQGSALIVMQRFAEFGRALEPMGRALTGLTLTPRLAWELDLDGGMQIRLGRDHTSSVVRDRLDRFVRHWPEAERKAGGNILVADLRYPGGFALTPAVAGKGSR